MGSVCGWTAYLNHLTKRAPSRADLDVEHVSAEKACSFLAVELCKDENLCCFWPVLLLRNDAVQLIFVLGSNFLGARFYENHRLQEDCAHVF